VAITTIDQAFTGMQPVTQVTKLMPTVTAGRPVSSWGLAGLPAAGTFNTTLAGGTYTGGPANANLVPGQIYRLDPPNPKRAYLARFSAISNSTASTGIAYVCDRLWDNGGITITSTGAQTVNSVAWPARDANGTTNGLGVFIGVEVSATTGAGTPTITVGYTNSNGVAGKTAGLADSTTATSPVGAFFRNNVAAGDQGVQSVQSVTLGTSWTSGTINLVAYRVLGVLPYNAATGGLASFDLITGGFQRVWNGTCPFVIVVDSGTASTLSAWYQESWG